MDVKDLKILIGDDSILARKQLKDVLTSLGVCNILDASNGQEVIDMYQEYAPDLVFLDIVMPVKDGNTALSEIKKIDPKANIIVLSSMGTQSQLMRSIQLGAKNFIQKPFSRQAIVSIIEDRLEGGA